MSINIVTNTHLDVTDKWAAEVKPILEREIQLDRHVSWLMVDTDSTIHIPSLSQLTTYDYSMGAQAKYQDISTGEFTLSLSEYKQTGFSIPKKFETDTIYVSEVLNYYTTELVRAFLREKESAIAHMQASQTASNPNLMDGADHRFVSVATSELGGLKDLQLARLALQKSKALTTDSTFYISPDFAFELQQITNFISTETRPGNNSLAEGSAGGYMDAVSSVGRIAGLNIMESSVLDYNIAETIAGTSGSKYAGSRSVTAGIANMGFGHQALKGVMKGAPVLTSAFDIDIQSTKYVATIEYGLGLYRPESMVVCLTDNA